MVENRQDYPSELAKARQQLKIAEARVAELETQLFDDPQILHAPQNPAKLLVSDNRYRGILDSLLEGADIIGFDWRYLYVNDASAAHGRMPKEVLLRSTVLELYPGIENSGMFATLKECMEERTAQHFETEFVFPNGEAAWFDLSVQPIPEGIFILSLDITERKQAEDKLRRSEERLRFLIEGLKDYSTCVLDADGHFVSWNIGAERLKGYRSDEILGQHYSRFFTAQDRQEGKPQRLLKAVEAQGRIEDEGWRVRKDGSLFWANVIITALRNNDGSLYGFAKITRDVTQRKHNDEIIRNLNRTLSVLSETNQAIVRIHHLPTLFEKACAIAVKTGAFRMAWIGLLEPETGHLKPVAQAGLSDGYLEKLHSVLRDEPQSQHPAYHPIATALRTGIRWVCNDLENDPQMLPWRADALRLGYRSSAAWPLMISDTVHGVFNLYSDEVGFFNEDELRLLDEMAMDIAFAMKVAEQEERRRQTQAALLKSESRYRRTLDNMLESCEILGFDWRFLYVNDTAVRYNRQTKEELLGSTLWERFPGLEKTDIGTVLQRSMQERTVERIEHEYTFADGSSIWYETSVQPVDEGIFIISLDVTERKSAEVRLRRYAQRLKILHEIDTGIINASSIHNVVETALKHIREFFGCQQAGTVLLDFTVGEVVFFALDLSAASALNKGIRYPIPPGFLDEFSGKIVTVIDDIRLLQQPSPAYQQLIKEGMRSSLRALLTFQGQPIGVLALTADTPNFFTSEHEEIASEIGDQLAIAVKQMQLSDDLARHIEHVEGLRQFLQETLDAFPANVSVLEADGTIVSVNQPWTHFSTENNGDAMTGYLGMNYLSVCDRASGQFSEEARAAAEGIRAVITGENDEFYLEYPCNSETIDRWYMLRVTPLDGPVPRRVVVAHIDISEQQAAEKAEREQRLVAETLRDSLAVLTSTLDVETVMNRILSYSEAVIPSDAGTIILFEGNVGRVACSRGFSAEAEEFFAHEVFPANTALIPSELAPDTHYFAADTASTPGWIAYPHTEWVRSSMGVPIVLRGETIGLLIADSGTPNRFQAKDLENLQAFARYAALALENAQYFDQLERRVLERTAELQAEKERVEAILNNSADGILLLNSDLTIQHTNAAFTRLFASEPGAYINKPLAELFETNGDRWVTKKIQSGVAEGQTLNLEMGAHRQDGSTFDSELSVGFIKEGGFVCTIRNITERKAQEKTLRYHARLQENVSEAVIVTDKNFLIQSWNKAAERIYGWKAEEVIGKQSVTILRTEYTTDEERKRTIQIMLEQGWWAGEVVQHHKDGSLLDVFGSISLVKDDHGISLGIVAINHDISERKRVEDALHRSAVEIHDLYNNAPCGYHSIDATGLIVQINETELRWLGYTQDEVVNKLSIADILTPESVLKFQSHFPAFKMQGSISDFELDLVRKDGTVLHIMLNGTAVYDAEGHYSRSRTSLFDMTELKRAQRELMEEEARYRLLAENVTDVIAKTDAAGIRTFITPSCYSLVGYTPQEMIGRPEFEIVHPDDRLGAQQVMTQALQSASSTFLHTQRVRHKDGHSIWVEVKGNIVCEPGTNTPVEVLAVIRDISERKRAEEALQASFDDELLFQSRLKALHEITIELTQIDDLNLFHRRTIELGLARLGFERLALFLYDEKDGAAQGTYGTDEKGQLFDEHHIRFIPDPKHSLLRALATAERRFVDENVILYADMKPVGVGWNAASILWNGTRNLGWIVADNLLTLAPASKAQLDILSLYTLTVGTLLAQKQVQIALRESESKYRWLVETMRGGLAIYDLEDRVTYVNDRACEILGYPPSEILGSRPYDFVDQETATEIKRHLDKRRLGESSSYELTTTQKSGSQVHMLVSGSPLFDQNGIYTGSFVVTTDITEHKKAEEALRQAFEKERELGELKSRFVSMASHEFRTPLSTILATTETLSVYRARLTEEQIEQRFTNIRNQVNHLKAIMEDVLQLARIQAGRVDFKAAPLDLDALCRIIIDELLSQYNRVHQVVYTCSTPLPEIRLDPKLMRQAISNLLSNAMKYSAAGTTITVNLAYTGSAIELSVRDEGIGIPKADFNHLFEPFHRAENVGAISGTGLGLSITKESVELHGGTIHVESQVGVGTTFTVKIPLIV